VDPDPDPGGLKTCGSGGSGSGTLRVNNVPGVIGEQGGVVDPGPGGELVGMMMMIIRDEFFTFLILFIRGTRG
jgi:hypothetical protein